MVHRSYMKHGESIFLFISTILRVARLVCSIETLLIWKAFSMLSGVGKVICSVGTGRKILEDVENLHDDGKVIDNKEMQPKQLTNLLMLKRHLNVLAQCEKHVKMNLRMLVWVVEIFQDNGLMMKTFGFLQVK